MLSKGPAEPSVTNSQVKRKFLRIYIRNSNGLTHPANCSMHRTGDTLSRTTWMLVAGPGIREGVVFDRALESTDLVPTLGSMLGFSPRWAQGTPIHELL